MTNRRILSLTSPDGRVRYILQKRVWFIWVNHNPDNYWYDSFQEAVDNLERLNIEDAKEKILSGLSKRRKL